MSVGHSLDPPPERRLKACGQRDRVRQPRVTGQLLVGEPRRELEQGQRVPGRLAEQSLAHRRGDLTADVLEQRNRLLAIQRIEDDLLPGRFETSTVVISHGEQEDDAFGGEPPRGEHQRVRRWHVEPLGIVDQAHDGSLLGRRRQQREHARRDEKALRPLRRP